MPEIEEMAILTDIQHRLHIFHNSAPVDRNVSQCYFIFPYAEDTVDKNTCPEFEVVQENMYLSNDLMLALPFNLCFCLLPFVMSNKYSICISCSYSLPLSVISSWQMR